VYLLQIGRIIFYICTTHLFSSPNNFSTAESKILISKLKIYILKLIYGSVWYSYNLKLSLIPDSDCFETTYVRVVIACTVNAWCSRVTDFATLINVPRSALVTLSCGSETELAGQVVTDVKYLWPHAEISSEPVSWAAGCNSHRQTNPAVSTLHQSEIEFEWMRLWVR